MFNVLDRYIGRTILNTIMMALFLLVSLSGIIKFVDQLRKVGNGDYTTLGAAFFTLLSVPKDIELFFPMAALLGSLLGLGALATRSELVVMQASGFTKMQVAMAVLKTAIPLVLLTMAIGEWVAPKGDQSARNLRAQMMYGSSLLSSQDGLWAKDGNDFIYIRSVKDDGDTSTLSGVNIYSFDDQSKLQSLRYAASAAFDKEAQVWKLSQVDESNLTDLKKITGQQTLTGTWKTNLTPDKLGVVVIKSDALSISGLYTYIKYLDTTGQEAKSYKLSFWKKVFTPLSVVVMMLMALSFIFGPLRSVAMGVRMVAGISCGFIFFLLNEVFGKMSQVSSLPPVISAVLPSLLFLGVSFYLLRKRD